MKYILQQSIPKKLISFGRRHFLPCFQLCRIFFFLIEKLALNNYCLCSNSKKLLCGISVDVVIQLCQHSVIEQHETEGSIRRSCLIDFCSDAYLTVMHERIPAT